MPKSKQKVIKGKIMPKVTKGKILMCDSDGELKKIHEEISLVILEKGKSLGIIPKTSYPETIKFLYQYFVKKNNE